MLAVQVDEETREHSVDRIKIVHQQQFVAEETTRHVVDIPLAQEKVQESPEILTKFRARRRLDMATRAGWTVDKL